MGNLLDGSVYAAIEADHNAGMSWREAGIKHGLSKVAAQRGVRRWKGHLKDRVKAEERARKTGTPPVYRVERMVIWTPELIAYVLGQVEAGQTACKIACKLGVSYSTLKSFVHKEHLVVPTSIKPEAVIDKPEVRTDLRPLPPMHPLTWLPLVNETWRRVIEDDDRQNSAT